MRNKYLADGDERAPKVREMFSRLAWRYDLVNDVMSFGLHRLWKRQTVRIALAGNPAERCWTLLRDRRSLLPRRPDGSAPGDGARFHAPDARGRAPPPAAEGSERHFAEGDALRLPFPDGSFHAITVAYGLRNIADSARPRSRKCAACSLPAGEP